MKLSFHSFFNLKAFQPKGVSLGVSPESHWASLKGFLAGHLQKKLKDQDAHLELHRSLSYLLLWNRF